MRLASDDVDVNPVLEHPRLIMAETRARKRELEGAFSKTEIPTGAVSRHCLADHSDSS